VVLSAIQPLTKLSTRYISWPVRMASNFLEVWESQPPGILKFCTGISLPSHLRSAACRFTQFSTSINNVLFQRGSRPASCVVDVDWLKVWVQLKGKGINEDYRDVHLK